MALLHFIEYIILAASLVASLSIGVYYACAKDKNKTPEDYLIASRKMNIIPIAVSFLVSFFSAISMLGNASEVYYYGIEFWLSQIGWTIGVVLSSIVYIPLMHPLKLTSINEYILLRYNSKVLMYVATLIQSTAYCLVNGIVIFGSAIVLESMAGIPVWITILITGVVSTIYTSVGGFQAVIWSDVFQAVIIFIGLIVINVMGTIKVGGIAEVWQIFSREGKLNLNWNPSPFVRSTPWNFSFGMGLTAFFFMGVSQVAIQRFSALPTLKMAQRCVYYMIVPHLIIVSLTCTSGIVAFAYFAHIGCDPLKSGEINNPNQIIPHFIKEVLNYPCVPGLFMACIACGTFSNLSSFYNSVSALIWEDILKEKLQDYQISELRKALITKIIAFITGVLSTCGGFIVAELKGTLVQLAFTIGGAAIAPISVSITLGALTSRTSWKCAVVGGVIAPSFIMWVNMGSSISGVNKAVLTTLPSNCSHNVQMYANTSHLNNSIESFNEDMMSEDLYDTEYNLTSSINMGKHIDKEVQENSPVFFLYKLSYMLVTPVGLFIGISVGLLLSFIPGFKNQEKVDPKLLFPIVRYFMVKAGYLEFEVKEKGLYVMKDSNEKHNENKL